MPIDWTFPIGLVLGIIIGCFSSFYLWIVQKNQHRKNIAVALKVDIKMLDEKIRPLAYLEKIQQIYSWGGDNSSFVLPFYAESDLYYSVRKDISIFDEQLSGKIHEFYKNIIDAEKYRSKLIQRS